MDKLDKSICEQALYNMLLIRRFEERAAQAYGMGKIGGFCHLYIGQEAVAAGFVAAGKAGDNHITSYRDHGHILALGADPGSVMAELMGKGTGCSKGKGGSMHIFAPDRGFYGGHGIVGAQVPLGTGLAFADKYRGSDCVTFVYYGDGAAHQGQVFEAFNMAKMWNLPVIYIVENNGYSMGTSLARSTAAPDLYNRGQPFGMPCSRINGMDFVDVYNAASDAVTFVRGGGGPVLIEVQTYRYRGHSMSDPAKYRTKEEVDEYKENKDPIVTMQSYVAKHGLLTEEDIKAIELRVKSQIQATMEFVDRSADPDENELWSDVC